MLHGGKHSSQYLAAVNASKESDSTRRLLAHEPSASLNTFQLAMHGGNLLPTAFYHPSITTKDIANLTIFLPFSNGALPFTLTN